MGEEIRIYDRLGRQVGIEDLCVVEAPRLLTWELKHVREINAAEAGLPDGAMAVELSWATALRMPVMANQPIPGLLIVETQQDRRARQAINTPRIVRPS